MGPDSKGESEPIPIFVHGSTRPKDVEDFKWLPQRHFQNRGEIIGWRRVGTEPAGGDDPKAFVVPREKLGKGGEVGFQEDFMDKVDKSAEERNT